MAKQRWTADLIPDQSGRIAVVTGGNSGIGYAAARALANAGAEVIIASRSQQRGEYAVASIRAKGIGGPVRFLSLDLASLRSVRQFVAAFQGRYDRLDLLINNAGVMACPLTRTPEGWELQFATNHLGHFLLTNGLKPALVAAGGARVVSLTSGGHRGSDVVFDDLHFERREYEKWSGYGQAKTANILFAVELDRRWRGHGIRANAVHPGAISTDLNRHLTEADMTALLARIPGGKMPYKSLGAGAATSVWAATAPELADEGGHYLEDCHIGVVKQGGVTGVEPYAVDPASATRLWEISETLLGERFD